MRILNNNDKENNHYKAVCDIISNSDELCIVSPFISSNINMIDSTLFQNLNSLTFITTLPNLYEEQEKKVRYFQHLISIAKRFQFNLEIWIDDSLHGKIYLGRKKEACCAVITSANYTNSGLKVNNEWGVIVEDSQIVIKMWNTIIASSRLRKLTEVDIQNYAEIIKTNKITKLPVSKEYYRLPASSASSVIPILNSQATCWLKPMGTTDNPVPNSDLHDTPIREITFSDTPVGIKNGDIIICYATKRKYILGVYKAISAYYTNKNGTVWKYSVDGENLFPYYGAHWFEAGVTINTIRDEVQIGGAFTITPNGKNNYNRLRLADKMIVTNEYAEYVITKLAKKNSEFALTEITD